MIIKTRAQKEKLAQDMADMARKRTQAGDVWKRLLRNKLGMLGFVIVVVLIILCVFANLFTKYSPDLQQFGHRFEYPSAQFWLGTDNFGRDLWSRLLFGGRVSLLVSFIATLISGGLGAVFGAVAGYFGGKTDAAITRVMDVLMAVPGILMAISVSVALGSGPLNTALAISISGIPYGVRIMRSTVMAIKGNDFVEAAKATGSKSLRLIFKHIVPNTLSPLLISTTLMIGGNIMIISGLSFVGLGVVPPTPEWGSILVAGRQYIRQFWPIVLFPSIFIMLTLFGFNLFGDGLRDALDPRLKD